MSQRIVIVGAGAIGTALGELLQKAGNSATLWDIDGTLVADQRELKLIIPGADLVFLCVPSWATRSAVGAMIELLDPGTGVITLAKGIEEKTHLTVDEVLRQALPRGQSFGLLGGAMLSKELSLGMLSVGVVATEDKILHTRVADVFRKSPLYVLYSSDVHGAAIASVLKNIYATAFGIADGLGWSSNIKGWLTAQALDEMVGIGKVLGAHRRTIRGLAGLGDLVATGFSPYSNNRTMGENLIRTGTFKKPREGLVSLPSVVKLLGPQSDSFPLLSALREIVINHTKAKKIFEHFVTLEQDK